VANVEISFADNSDDLRFDNFQPFGGSCLKRKSSRRPTENFRANVAPLRPKGDFRAADSVESSVKLPTAPNTKSPISETWFRRFRRRMVRRNIHGLLGLRDRPPKLHAPVSDAFRALLAGAKSKPSIVFCAREVLGNHR
jgi:hypothetical protein